MTDLQFQRGVERLHACGPRPVCELLRELGRDHMCMTAIERLVSRYTTVSPDIHRRIGSDRYPPPPLHEVA